MNRTESKGLLYHSPHNSQNDPLKHKLDLINPIHSEIQTPSYDPPGLTISWPDSPPEYSHPHLLPSNHNGLIPQTCQVLSLLRPLQLNSFLHGLLLPLIQDTTQNPPPSRDSQDHPFKYSSPISPITAPPHLTLQHLSTTQSFCFAQFLSQKNINSH